MARTAFKVGDKVKIRQAVRSHHVGLAGEVVEVAGDLLSVKVPAPEGSDHTHDTLGCVSPDHVEAHKGKD